MDPELDRVLEQRYRFVLRKRGAALFPGGDLAEHEARRLSLFQSHLGVNPVRIALKRDRGGKTQTQIGRVKRRAVGAHDGLMFIAGVIKGGSALDAKLHRPANDVNAAHQPMVTVSVGMLADGHVIGHLSDAIGGQEAGDEHIGAGPVELLVDNLGADRRYLEKSALLVIEKGGKHTGRIETRETLPIDRAVQPHQCRGTHIADDAVVFYGLISHELSPVVPEL